MRFRGKVAQGRWAEYTGNAFLDATYEYGCKCIRVPETVDEGEYDVELTPIAPISFRVKVVNHDTAGMMPRRVDFETEVEIPDGDYELTLRRIK